ncbi:hypothetical protein FACS189434_01310 [Bacteroidia bacterium]|nr:hypothetical protein FACS189434_01310 [Bacteroidia bacterium]
MTVHFNSLVDNIIGQYYEDYIGSPLDNDLWIRVLYIRRIKEFLSSFDLSDTYIVNGKKYIDVYDIATIQYVIRNQGTEILVENIYFKN